MADTTNTPTALVYCLPWLYLMIPFILRLDTQELVHSTGTRSSGQNKAHPSEVTHSLLHSTAYLYNHFTVDRPAGINL